MKFLESEIIPQRLCEVREVHHIVSQTKSVIILQLHLFPATLEKTPFLVKIRLVLHSVGFKWSEASRYKSFIVFSILTIVLFVLLDINLNISLPLRALFLKYSPLSFHKFPRTNRNFDNTKFSQMTPRFTRIAKFTIILEAVSVYKFGKLAFRYIYYLNFTSIELR